MIRGALSNTLSPSLWVHSEVLLTHGKRYLLIGPKRETVHRLNWLWAVSHFAKPVIIYIDRAPSPLLKDYDHLRFDTFTQCKESLRRDYRAVEIVVDDPNLACDVASLYNPNIKRYC